MKIRIWMAVLLCLLLLSACAKTAAPAPANLGTIVGKTDAAAAQSEKTETTPQTASEPETEDPSEGDDPAPAEPENGDGPVSGEPEESPDGEPEDGPEEDPAAVEADYTALAGVWFGQYSTEVLTIYENGGFLLQTDAGCEYGSLRYTEEEGDLWEPVPRYEMILENNEQLYGDASISLDEWYPGTITCTVGAGASLFDREIPDWSTDDGLVQARFPSGPWIDCTVAEISDDEPTAEVLFTAAGVVEDFRILSLQLEDVKQDGTPVFQVNDEYRQETLPQGWPVLAVLSFYGDIPNNGFCYTDELGETHFYSVSISGYDGSLVLSEF